MAFPVVEDTAATDGNLVATSHDVSLPATISSNALLIVVGRAAVAGAVAVTGGGWTITQDDTDGSDDVTFWMYRNTLAAGTEDGSTITVTHGSGKLSAISLSITGAVSPATQAPESSTVAVGTGTSPNATTCTPTGGAKDYLWITFHGADGEHTISAYPYASNNVVASTLAAGAVGINNRTALCTTTSNAASLDAGAFTTSINVNSGWTAWTIAVHPYVAQTLYGAVVSPFTLGRLANGVRTTLGQIAFPFTFGEVVNGVRVGLGQVATPITFGVLSDGTVEGGGGADWFGTVLSPLTWDAVTSGHLAQLAHPTADSVDGAWTNELGGADLEGSIDDLTVSDADYIQSELNPDVSACRIKLEGLTDPASSSGHVLRWRIAKDAAAGSTVSLTLTLRQGGGDVLGAGTEIATFTRSDVTETFTTFEEHLSAAQADAITDYSALYLEITGDVA